eukprot:750079-Hanusia_phi.AAC.1
MRNLFRLRRYPHILLALEAGLLVSRARYRFAQLWDSISSHGENNKPLRTREMPSSLVCRPLSHCRIATMATHARRKKANGA